MNHPTVSIVIPTRNRQQYCIEAIKNVLSFDYTQLELIIQDDSDDYILESFVLNLNDSRAKYFHTKNNLPSVENMNQAVARAHGEYICMLGDDDAILPEFFNVLNIAIECNLDSICPQKYVEYFWPTDTKEGYLIIPQFSGNKTLINISISLLNLFKSGIVNYSRFGLPRVYHGLVKKEKLDIICKTTGHYFGGLSPDIYSAVSLSSFIQKNVIYDTAFTIAGACPASSTALSIKNKHNGELSQAPHLALFPDYKWSELIPKYYSVSTIWAESAIKAAQETNSDVYKYFKVSKMLSYSIIDDRNILKLIILKTFDYCKSLKLSVIGIYSKILFNIIMRIMDKIYKQLRRKSVESVTIPCSSIIEAVEIIKKYEEDKP